MPVWTQHLIYLFIMLRMGIPHSEKGRYGMLHVIALGAFVVCGILYLGGWM